MTTGMDCTCWQGHHDGCKHFNYEQGYNNLKGTIEHLQTLMADGFKVNMFKSSLNEFVLEAVHPHQAEEFTKDDLLSLFEEVGEWCAFCKEAE